MVKPQGRETAPEPGFQSLTDREADMLVLIAAGRTDRQIAASLRLSENTVSTYVTRLLVKFGAANRAELTDDPGAPTVTAHMLSQSRSRTLDLLASGSWRTRTITTYYDGDARVTAVDDNPQGSAETCTATSYATPPAGNAMMLSYPKQVTTVTGAASSGSCPAASSSGIVSATRYYYDDESATLTSMGTLGSLASPGGLVTGVVKAVTWPAGGSEQWVPQSVSVYDAYGRVTSVTDARGKATGTSYSPAGVLPTSVTVTNPKTWTTVTQLDQGRQLPVKVTDVNGEVTSETYDALGRLTSVTQPIDQNTGYPTDKFTYYVTGTSPPVVEARTLRQDGSYGVKHSIYDGMGQLRQVQQTPADNEPGMVVTDTFYDSRGQVVKSSGPYYVSGVVPSATVYETKSDSAIASQTLTGYDGQGRVTKSVFYSDAVRQWETDTAYPGMNETDVTPPAGGTATSSFTNALGQVTASWMYSGSVTPDGKQADADVTAYAYTPAGQVASVTDGNQNVTSFTYDLLGRKAQEVSPDSGTTNWGYDAAGNVQSVSTGGGRLPTPTTA